MDVNGHGVAVCFKFEPQLFDCDNDLVLDLSHRSHGDDAWIALRKGHVFT